MTTQALSEPLPAVEPQKTIAPPKKKTRLSRTLRQVVRSLLPKPRRHKDKVELFRCYHQALVLLACRRKELEYFLNLLCAKNGFPGAVRMRETTRPSASTAQTARLDLRELSSVLGNDLAARARDMIEDFVSALDDLVEQRRVGLIEWEADGVCFFHYYGYEVQTGKTGERRSATHIERDFERTETLHFHRHDLVGAEPLPITADVAKPSRVATLIDAIPVWLSPHMHVVTGNQISEQTSSQVMAKDQWTEAEVLPPPPAPSPPRPMFRWDPALVFGQYVLAGWTEEDIRAETRQRVQGQAAVAGAGALALMLVVLLIVFWNPIVAFLWLLTKVVFGIGCVGLLGFAAFHGVRIYQEANRPR